MKSCVIHISGEVPSKKNSYRFGSRGIFKPPEVTEFEKMVADEILAQKARKYLSGPLYVQIVIKTASTGDLDNKVTTLLDAIQYGVMIKNDRDVVRILADKVRCARSAVGSTVTVSEIV